MSTAATETSKGIGKGGIAQVALIDEMKQLGWRAAEHTDGSGFSAHEINGDRKIGPTKTLEALKKQVDLASGPPAAKKGNGKTVKTGSSNLEGGKFSETSHTADQRLPSMEEPEIDELNLLGDNCIDAKEKRDQAKTAFDDSCDIMRAKMHEYGRKRYNRHGFSLVIEDSEKLVIKKAEQAPPKNPKQAKKTAGEK